MWELTILGVSELWIIFSPVGTSYENVEHVYSEVKAFVCNIYGGKRNNVNRLRSNIFWRVLKTNNTIIDLSLHHLNCTSSNYIARIWGQATETTMDIGDPRYHRWNDDISLQRPQMLLPDDLIKHIGAGEVAEEYGTVFWYFISLFKGKSHIYSEFTTPKMVSSHIWIYHIVYIIKFCLKICFCINLS